MAKDEHGHGSDGRGSAGAGRRLPFGVSLGFRGTSQMKPDRDFKSGGAAVVAGLRGAAGIADQHGIQTSHLGGGGYNREAVQKAIDSSNRAGRPIGGREAGLIHALLRGRH